MSAPNREKIELLPVGLLDRNRPQVDALRRLAKTLKLEFGWHYLLDLTWIIEGLGAVQGKRVMDAGAGTGVLQWWLAQEGADVLSVDRLNRAALRLRFRNHFQVRGLRKNDLLPFWRVFQQNWASKGSLRSRISLEARDMLELVPYAALQTRHGPGRVTIYNQDLKDLADIPSDSLDAVVAVSALEHNTPEGLGAVVQELMRVLKPGGKLLATLCAARDGDVWHTPSQGWCYSDRTLRRLFQLPEDTPSNYEQFDRLFADLKECTELRNGLAAFYYRSGENGMPWGKWDPQYIPVGVCKIKPA